MKYKARATFIFPLVLLSMLALMTFWLSKVAQPPTPKMDGSSRHDPDYVITNFVTTQTDINGNLHYKLAAIEMKHYPDDDSAVLQRPRYTQFALDKPYTQVHGLRGNVSSNGDEVELFDQVKVTRQAFAGKGEMTVETDYLSILPKEEIVRTEHPVVIRQAPKTVIYATGMLYEKKKRTVTLLHKVRAHYERPVVPRAAAKKAPSVAAKKVKAPVKKVKPNKTKTSAKKADSTKVNQLNTTNTNNARIRRRYE